MKRELIIEKLKCFLNDKIVEFSSNNQLILIIKPFLDRSVNNAANKINVLLKMVEDEHGNIDIKQILKEMGDNLMVSTVKQYPDIFNGAEIGNGKIKINIPLINKCLVLSNDDINNFINYLSRPQ